MSDVSAAGEVIKEHSHPDKSEPFFDEAATVQAIAYGYAIYMISVCAASNCEMYTEQ